MKKMSIGRIQLFTDYKIVDESNLIKILQKVMPDHRTNANRIQALKDFEENEQKQIREKTYRKEIDNWVPDPIANTITDFKCGFEWGNLITYVLSKNSDGRDVETLTMALSEFNKCFRLVDMPSKQQELARSIEIGGVGYEFIDINTDYTEGDNSPFTVDILDPTNTFVVRSRAYTDRRIVLAGTYSKDDEGLYHFTLFTKDMRYEMVGTSEVSLDFVPEHGKDANPLGAIPIIEWVRSYDHQGCFERFVPNIQGLTLAVSDFLNDVDQNTQAVWWSSDVEFPTKEVTDESGNVTEEIVKPKDGDWLLTETTKDGKNAKIQPLTIDYDYSGMLENIASTRAYILKCAHVPQRNDNSGGSTGVAMDDAAGWTDAEAEACRKEMIMTRFKMEEARLALLAIRKSPFFKSTDSPLLSLYCADIEPNFKRSKTYDLVSKINSICTGLSHGFALEDMLSNIPLFADNSQVIARSGEGVRRYQETILSRQNEAQGAEGESSVNSDRLQADLSDQISQSPTLGNG